MKKIFALLLFITVVTPSFADYYYQPNTRINKHYRNQYNYYPYISDSDLSALEQYALKKNYGKEPPLRRLERLENMAFGAVQYGDIESRYKNVETAILSRPSANRNINRKNWLGNLSNYFAGQATGLTPSITIPNYTNDFYAYGPDYGTRRYEQFSNGIFGSGYNLMNQNFGNGSSIRILP